MTEQQKVNVMGYLEQCENKLSMIACMECLPTSYTVDELVEAMRLLSQAVKETIQ